MRAFWWFEDNLIAGMARPGFNLAQWFDLEFDEAVVMGWIGQFSSGPISLDSFQVHLKTYALKIAEYYPEKIVTPALKALETISGMSEVLEKLSRKADLLESFSFAEDNKKPALTLKFSAARLEKEIEFIKNQGIKTIVCLTEDHHDKELLRKSFDLHHFSTKDLEAPRLEHALKMTELLRHAKKIKKPLAVHCLAGIGRTSTILIAAHLAMGRDFIELHTLVKTRNPTYDPTENQASFLEEIRSKAVRN